MQKAKKHPKPPRNLKSTKVTHDSVTLDWVYEGANDLELIVNDESKGKVSGGHFVLNNLTPETEYKIKVKDSSGLESNEVTITTLKFIKATHVYFSQQYVNVIPSRPTRLQVFIVPEDASDKSVIYETNKGTIKDGYITLDSVDDVADVKVSLPDKSHSSECKVVCVKEDIPVKDIQVVFPESTIEVGEVSPVGVGYTPPNTSQRAVEMVSSKPSIAKVVNEEGNFRVTGIKAGKAKITVTSKYNDSIKAVFDVEVVDKPIPPTDPEAKE